jgi:hypothetical protein
MKCVTSKLVLKLCGSKVKLLLEIFQFSVISYEYANEFTGSMMDLEFVGRLIVCWPVKKDCSLLMARACQRREASSL